MPHKDKYYSIENGQILVHVFKGEIDYENIVTSYQYIHENQLLKSEHKGIISHFLDAKFNLSKEHKQLFINCIETNIPRHIKMAPLIDSTEIIYPMMHAAVIPNHMLKPFSTIEEAIVWIINQ